MSNGEIEYVYPYDLTSEHLGRIISFTLGTKWYVGRLTGFMINKPDKQERYLVFITVRTTEMTHTNIGSLDNETLITVFPYDA